MPCLFGCDGHIDSFTRYAQRHRLKNLVCFLIREPIVYCWHIWGLVDPSPGDLKRLCCVVMGYHALPKHAQNHLASLSRSQLEEPTLHPSAWPGCWAAFSEAFIVEAGEQGLPTRTRFTAPQFLAFLADAVT